MWPRWFVQSDARFHARWWFAQSDAVARAIFILPAWHPFLVVSTDRLVRHAYARLVLAERQKLVGKAGFS